MAKYNSIQERKAFYIEHVTKTDSRCMICQQQDKLVVDHNHTTGDIRGLLCTACNSGIGFFRDTPEFLMSAAVYLGDKGYSYHTPPSFKRRIHPDQKDYLLGLLNDSELKSDTERARAFHAKYGGVSLDAIKMRISRFRKDLDKERLANV